MRRNFLLFLGLATLATAAHALSPVSVVPRDDLHEYRYEDKYWNSNFLKTLEREPSFLSKDHVFDLPAPPANDSEETAKEIAYIDGLRAKRDHATVELIHFEAGRRTSTVEMLERSGIVPQKLWNLDAFNRVLRQAYFDVSPYFVMREKKRFSRPRPSHLAPALDLVIDNPGHPAYPSGHATESRLLAVLVGEIVPEHAKEMRAYANSIAHRREIAGVHYPSDSKAGQLLGEQIAAELLKHPEFATYVAEAKAAVAKAKATK